MYTEINKRIQLCEDCIGILDDHLTKLRDLNTKQFKQISNQEQFDNLSTYIKQEEKKFLPRKQEYKRIKEQLLKLERLNNQPTSIAKIFVRLIWQSHTDVSLDSIDDDLWFIHRHLRQDYESLVNRSKSDIIYLLLIEMQVKVNNFNDLLDRVPYERALTSEFKDDVEPKIIAKQQVAISQKLPLPISLLKGGKLLTEEDVCWILKFFDAHPTKKKISKKTWKKVYGKSYPSVLKVQDRFSPIKKKELVVLDGKLANQGEGAMKSAYCIAGNNQGSRVQICIKEFIRDDRIRYLQQEESIMQEFNRYLGSQIIDNTVSRNKNLLHNRVSKYYTVYNELCEAQKFESYIYSVSHKKNKILLAFKSAFKAIQDAHDKKIIPSGRPEDMVYDPKSNSAILINFYLAKQKKPGQDVISSYDFFRKSPVPDGSIIIPLGDNQFKEFSEYPPECYPNEFTGSPGHVSEASNVYMMGLFFAQTNNNLPQPSIVNRMLHHDENKRATIKECIEFFNNRLKKHI